jgi:PAS domain S-box-containing protein
MELFDLSLALLRSDDISVHRGRRQDREPVLVAQPSSVNPPRSVAVRLENEFELRSDLDVSWSAWPTALTRLEGRIALVLADPGGVFLSSLVGRPFDVRRFLDIAIAMAAACSHMHRHGLIHKDIKPANFLVDESQRRAWLTGFGVASRVSREYQDSAPPAMLVGTLAYMAPEQTGRMNRSVDSRSDLYALGITFYEMLTGSLPFAADDSMELVHCHIARQPVPPHNLLAGIPQMVSAIVMKLLAKTLEDRYQTAQGVEEDLRKCRQQWDIGELILPFPLGARDCSRQLVIPAKLYGRGQEVQTLLTAFAQVVMSGTSGLVLVSGSSGIGKSSIVNALRHALVPARGLFAAGKFDQYKSDIPYATLAQAFSGLVQMILRGNESELERWRTEILDAVGAIGQLLVDLVPDLSFVIGPQPPVHELPPQEAHARFQMVLRRFVGVFATPDHPLALFLDDLQWLDHATLNFIRHLVAHKEVQHLLLIGAYRDNEVEPSHPLALALEALRDSGVPMREITLTPLELGDTKQLIADTFRCEDSQAGNLASLVLARTGGNPLFTIQFISKLFEDGLIVFDATMARWTWELSRILDRGCTGNGAQLIIGRLGRLSPVTRQTLSRFACLGNATDVKTLAWVEERSSDDAHEALSEAVDAGFVLRAGDGYMFLHDRVQEAAYRLIPETERAAEHYRIGRLLASRTPPDERDEKIFDIANHINRGSALIRSPNERDAAVSINLSAGMRAKAGAAYASALTYFEAARALHPDASWQEDFSTIFRLEFYRAECEFLSGALGPVGKRLTLLSEHASTLADKTAVARLRIAFYAMTDHLDRAVEIGLAYLRDVDIGWPMKPTDADVRREYAHMQQLLGDREIEQLASLPMMISDVRLAIMEVLVELTAPAVLTDMNLRDLIIIRMVNISLEYGCCDASCYAYSALSSALSLRFGDYRRAFRFGKLGHDLVNTTKMNRFQAKVLQWFGGMVLPWSRSLEEARVVIMRAVEVASANGDQTTATFGTKVLVANLVFAGEQLSTVRKIAEQNVAFVEKIGAWRFVCAVAGELDGIQALDGTEPDDNYIQLRKSVDARMDQQLALPISACHYWIRELRKAFFAHDFLAGVEAAQKAEDITHSMIETLELAEFHFYGALTRAIYSDHCSADQRTQLLEKLRMHSRQMTVWAEYNPSNFACRAALLAAETARIENRELDAQRLYEEAVQLSRKYGFIQVEAIANELAGRFYQRGSLDTIYQTYIRQALTCYARWGAMRKVRQLEELHPYLRSEVSAPSCEGIIGTSVDVLDLATVLKVLEAVSGEIDLERLTRVLMTIALEYAGGDRGILIMPHAQELEIEAQAWALSDGVEVRIPRENVVIASDTIPVSLIQYVTRTQQFVLLDDARKSHAFSGDGYFRTPRCRSVLCLPLIKQNRLIGVLYLENQQASHVFTPARIAVLKLLAAQAAASLENAQLYAERRKAEEALRVSEAFLTLGQHISHTGTFRKNFRTGAIEGSAEIHHIFGRERDYQLTISGYLSRVHPEDRPRVEQLLAEAARDGKPYNYEFRILLPDGTVKHLQIMGQPDEGSSCDLQYVGVTMDITERKQAEEALRHTQSELARALRLTTMGELAASIVHEINQPLTGVVTNAEAGLRWLQRSQPVLGEAESALSRVLQQGRRAADVVAGLRSLARKSGPNVADVNIDDAIAEVLGVLSGEIKRDAVTVNACGLTLKERPVLGDRVQLQQVLLNLIRNGIEATTDVLDRERVLTISSMPFDENYAVVSVEDNGSGLSPSVVKQMFEPLFTTKSYGMGMGLPICRSIVEAHRGRLWVSPREPSGANFRFTVPFSPQGERPG